MERVPASRFHELGVWRTLSDGANAFFRTDSFATSARFIAAIAELPGIEAHRPDVDVRPDGVTVRLLTSTAEIYGLTGADLESAERITEVARELGIAADPSALQTVMIIPGAPDTAAIIPFWQAVLGYEPRPDSPDEDLRDPLGRGPYVWFERMDEPRADGDGTIHLVVSVPHDKTQERIDAALAAGGRLVRDAGPEFWTLADPAGNQVDVA